MTLTIIGIVFFMLLAYLLFMPLVLYIDTVNDKYYLQVQGLAKASIEGHEQELLRIKLNIFFWHFYLYPLRYLGRSKIGKDKSVEGRRANKKENGNIFTLVRSLRVLKSFTVKKINLELDTGDWTTNAKIYPLFMMLNYRYGGCSINFEGRNQLTLQVVNRPIHILFSFINI